MEPEQQEQGPVLASIWKEQRWAALERHIDRLITNFEPGNQQLSQQVPGNATLILMLRQLRAFAGAHFSYFYDNFNNGKLRPHPLFPPQYVMHKVTARIAEDIEALEKALVQRLPQSELGEALLRADRLGCATLRVAKECQLIDPGTTAVVYFCKVPSIRVIPYAPVVLVGLPLTCLATTRDYLAIPHEVGHYVFWDHQAKAKRAELRTMMKGYPVWLRRWTEEIFADVYGAVVAGAAGALSLQDVENETSAEEFTGDDAVHPIPAIRPFIYDAVLKAKGAPLAGALEQRWADLLAQRKGLASVEAGQAGLTVQGDHGAELVLASTIRQYIERIVPEVLRMFGLEEQEGQLWRVTTAGATLYDEALYSSARERIEDSDQELCELQAADLAGYTWDAWMGGFPRCIPENRAAIPDEDWLAVFRAAGWTTSGPHSRDLD